MVNEHMSLGTTLTAIAVMALSIGSASARNFSVSNQNIRAVWTRRNLSEPFGVTTSCPVTLEGSLHSRTIAKVTYALIGYITRATVGPPASCVGGEATILGGSLPWHVRLLGFDGTLPDITRLRALLSGGSFKIRTVNGTCLFTTRENTTEHGLANFNRNVTTGQITSVDSGGEITSNEACIFGLRIRGRLEGTGSVTALNPASLIFVRLI
ncbi:MAG TPA: hypothetical protein VF250_02185 [Conexibacter sp.]